MKLKSLICLCAIVFAVTPAGRGVAAESRTFADSYRQHVTTNAPATMVPAMPAETNKVWWHSSPAENTIYGDGARAIQIVAAVISAIAFGTLPFIYFFERRKARRPQPQSQPRGTNGI